MTDDSIEVLVGAFLNRTLPLQDWTHSAHLVVGSWHVQRYGVSDAIVRLRDAIRGLNGVHGTPNTEHSGYHETITVAYARLLNVALASFDPPISFAAHVEAIVEGPLGERGALLRFWSRGVLMSSEARRTWVGPDIAELALWPGWRSSIRK